MIQSYPWYIADWRESETRLSLSVGERGLYRELLDYCYLEGSLPVDLSQLALIAAVPLAEFKRLWPKVAPLFVLDGKRMAHLKVNEVRAKLEIYHEQRRHAGSKSGQARRERAFEHPLNERSNGTSTKHSTAFEPSPPPTPSPSPTPTPTPSRFADFIAPWTRVPNPEFALRAWLSAIDTAADEEAAFAARDRYLASDEVSRGIVKDPAKWIVEQKSGGWGGKWPPVTKPNGVKQSRSAAIDEALKDL